MKRTTNLSNTQFRYQLVFFIHIYGWLKVAFGIFCLGKTCGGIFCLGKKNRRHLSPGGMLHLLQRELCDCAVPIASCSEINKFHINYFDNPR